MTNSSTPLNILGRLASQYHQRLTELKEITAQTPPELVAHQLEHYSERVTEQFRVAQQHLLANLDNKEGESIDSVIAICRCFDEMRILFKILLEQFPEPVRE
jgi:hypothetical protein